MPRDLEARFDAERKDLLAKVGELTLQVVALKKNESLRLDDAGRQRSGSELVNAVFAAMWAEQDAAASDTTNGGDGGSDRPIDGLVANLILQIIELFPAEARSMVSPMPRLSWFS